MDILNLINDIQAADPEFADRISPRRAAIKNITSFGSKVAVAALPFAFSTLFKKAYGQTATSSVVDVLNFALTAELTESCFYNTAIARINAGSLVIPSTAAMSSATMLNNIRLIQIDENNHVKFIKEQLGSNITPANAARTTTPIATGTTNAFFDYSGGAATATTVGSGPFTPVFSNYDIFLAVAQAFEDTGVRAYKGQAAFLKGNQTVLTAALGIHSVEARHAAFLRRARAISPNGPATLRPWVVGKDTTASGITVSAAATNATNPIYAGEDTSSQAGANLTGIAGANAATASFDEPLTKAEVLAILGNFVRA